MIIYEMRSNALANVVKQGFHQIFHINKPFNECFLLAPACECHWS